MSILPRYDAYGRMLGTSTDPDAEAHFTLYSVARDEIERVREQLRCLAQAVVYEDSRTVGVEGPSWELLELAKSALKQVAKYE